MFRQVIITNLVFHKLPTSLSCVQYPLWFRVRDNKNQRTKKQKCDREKYKHMQGHNKSILETGYQCGHPKNVPKWTSLLLCSKYIYVHLVHFNRQNSFPWGKIPLTVIKNILQLPIKKKKKKKNVIVNKNTLNKWKDLFFALFFLFFFFQRKQTCIFICISVNVDS